MSRISQQKKKTSHQDNVRLNASLVTRLTLLQLGWEVLIHHPYPADAALPDVHSFQSLQNSLNGKISIPWKTVKGTRQFFAQKDNKLWEDGITKLPGKWQKVMEQNNEYVLQ